MALVTSQILRAIAIGLGGLAALAAAVELSRAIPSDQTSQTAPQVPPGDTLARCRDLAPEDTARDTDCRAAWEAARRRFFDLAPQPAGTE